MTFEEKKRLLNAHKTEKMYWQVIVALQGLSILNGVYAILQYFVKHSVPGLFGGVLIIFILIALAINVWIAWGIYRLEHWVTLWLWLAVIGSALSFNVLGFVLSIIVLVAYKKVLKVVYPPAPTNPSPTTTV